MNIILLCAAMLNGSAQPVSLDSVVQQAKWPGWTIYSSDNLGFEGRSSRYPVTHLFDDDPSTAWVFPAKLPASAGGDEHRLRIGLGHPMTLDGIRIMNGYNKSQDLFFANDRIVELEVWSGRKQIKTVRLADRMGWHDISLPRTLYEDIELVFTKFARGRMDDVCISELRLMQDGIELPVSLSGAMTYATGTE